MTKASGNAPLFAEERREKILELLRESSKLLVFDLCDYFDVSPATVRNDLRELESAGRLKRTHGGAIPAGKASFEPNSRTKAVESIAQKQRIAQYAASLIEDGDAVALDTGTTTLELAKLLPAKNNLTVITNDIQIASYLEENSGFIVILPGGVLRRGFHCTTGPMVTSQLAGFNVDKAFMASNALSAGKGFTTPAVEQAEIKKAIISIASEVIFLVDSSKFGLISLTKFASLNDADKLITDSGAGEKTLQQFQSENDNLEITVV